MTLSSAPDDSRLRIAGEWLLILSGAASALFGLLLLIMPGTGALAKGGQAMAINLPAAVSE